jgi:hypothetical protein
VQTASWLPAVRGWPPPSEVLREKESSQCPNPLQQRNRRMRQATEDAATLNRSCRVANQGLSGRRLERSFAEVLCSSVRSTTRSIAFRATDSASSRSSSQLGRNGWHVFSLRAKYNRAVRWCAGSRRVAVVTKEVFSWLKRNGGNS